MPWSNEFKDALARDSYVPRFRLLIGTPAVSGAQLGGWEAPIAKVLEVSSHPYSSSIDSAAISGADGAWPDTGHDYKYVVGLTGSISTGAQSVKPREFTYQGATLTVGVTREAATYVFQMAHGTLTKLQMALMIDGDQWTEFENIHVGQYRGIKWNGKSYTVSMSDALEAATYRITDEEDPEGRSEYLYQWFAGCGVTATARAPMLDFTSGVPFPISALWTSVPNERWGATDKKSYAWGGVGYTYGDVSVQQNYVRVTNAAGNNTYIRHEGVHAFAGGAYVGLTNAKSTTSHELPGYLDGGTVTGAIQSGDTMTNVCLLSGTPVTEIVNTLYMEGYSGMVPGIFGTNEGTMSIFGVVNFDDLIVKKEKFNDMYTLATGETTGITTCFAHIVTAPSENGYSLIKKLTGKWGVFPVFREGGYSASVVLPAERENDEAESSRWIEWDDIQGAEITSLETSTQGGYRYLLFESTDDDVGTFSAALDGIKPDGTYPIFPDITFKTTEVAAGYGDRGLSYAKYVKNVLYANWFVNPRMDATVRLRGFRFAHLAPGDYVHINLPSTGKAEAWGPMQVDLTAMSITHALDSVGYFAGETAGGSTDGLDLFHRPWFVHSAQVDWVGCLVTLRLSRPVRGVAFSSFIDLPMNQQLTTAMAMPVHDIASE